MQKNKNISTIVKLVALIVQLNTIIIVDTRVINLNKKVFDKLYNILDFVLF